MIDPEDRDQIQAGASRARRTGNVEELREELRAVLSTAFQECDVLNGLAGYDEDCSNIAEIALNCCVDQAILAWSAHTQSDIFRLLRVRMAMNGVWLVVRAPPPWRRELRTSRGF